MTQDAIQLYERQIRTWQKVLVEVRGLWKRREISILQYWENRDVILSELTTTRKEIAALHFEQWRDSVRSTIASL